MLVRRLFVPCLLLSSLFTLHCSDDEPKKSNDDDAGEGGEAQSGSSGASSAARAGSSGAGGSQSVSGASGSATAGSSGSTSTLCDPGATRSCTGPAGCQGGQECETDGTWAACDCGSSNGGTSGTGTGGTSTAGEGGVSEPAGGASGAGGADDGGSAGTSGSGGSTANGGTSGSSGSSGSSAGGTGGAGGTAGTSGTGGSSGTAGTSGTGGSGGSSTGGSSGSGGTGGISCGVGEGLELVIEPGEDADSAWIAGTGNCVGIQGAIYLRTDPGTSFIDMMDNNGRICVEGRAARVLNGDFDTNWGAVVTIQLNNTTGSALPYNPTPYGVDGFSFNITPGLDAVTDIPPELRPRFLVTSQADYCKQVCDDGVQSILFSEAHPECWAGENQTTPALSALTTLEFHVPSNRDADVDFDFCIEDLTAIINGVSVGDPGECSSGGTGSDFSCVGNCGDQAASGCFCDTECLDAGDCCEDYEDVCAGG